MLNIIIIIIMIGSIISSMVYFAFAPHRVRVTNVKDIRKIGMVRILMFSAIALMFMGVLFIVIHALYELMEVSKKQGDMVMKKTNASGYVVP